MQRATVFHAKSLKRKIMLNLTSLTIEAKQTKLVTCILILAAMSCSKVLRTSVDKCQRIQRKKLKIKNCAYTK